MACTLPPAMAWLTISVALASACAARSRASASRKAASLRPSAANITACFSPSALSTAAWRRPSASRIWARLSRSAFIWRAMLVDEIARRGDILDLDARDLHAPGLGGRIDHLQQSGIDGVAIGEQLVEIHRAHHRADVGHRQIDDGALQSVDFVGCLGG